MSKKGLVYILFLIMALSFVGCSKSSDDDDDDDRKKKNEKVEKDDDDDDDDSDKSDKKDGTGSLGSLFGKKDDKEDKDEPALVTAAPDSPAGDDSGNGESGNDNGNGESGNDNLWGIQPQIREDVIFTVTKSGNDTVRVTVEDISGNNLFRGDDRYVYVYVNDGQDCVGFGSSYLGVSCNSGLGSTDYYSDYSDYVTFGNYMSGTVKGEGIAAIFSEGGAYRVSIYGGSDAETGDFGEGKISAIADVSAEELKEIMKSDALKIVSETPAHDEWVGEYICSSYNYDENRTEYGYISVSKSEGGVLVADVNSSALVDTFILEEKKFETVTYDYGTVTEAEAETPGYDYRRSATLRYSSEPGDPVYYYFDASIYASNNSEYYNFTLIPLNSADYRPADFVDEDRYGYVENILNDSSHFLYPSGDNYAFTADEREYVYYDGDDATGYPGWQITLYEFDDNNYCVAKRAVLILEDEASAAAVYNKDYSYSDEYKLQGNTITYEQDYLYYSHKSSCLYLYSYNCYQGAHYAYYKYDSDADYIYSSKPFGSESDISRELLEIMMAIPHGDHRSTDSKDATLYTSFSADNWSGIYLSLSVYSNEFNVYNSSSECRYEGNVVKFLEYYDGWSEQSVRVTEVAFTTETAVATNYTYVVDSLSNVNITLDNYSEFTPDKTVSHTFDVTRIKEN